MEITHENFIETLPLVHQSIKEADFVAIDTEFSGHSVATADKGHDYDTLEERYQKLKFAVQKFVAFQIGLCTFKWDEEAKKYIARPFVYYVFPRSKITDQTMLFQASAVSFLVGNNFDFNKLFNSAVSFARLSEADKVRQQCIYKITKSFPSERAFSCLSANHQKQLDEMMAKIDDWVYDPTSSNKLVFCIASYSLKKALSKKVTKVYMSTGVFTEFQRNINETIVKKSKSFKQSNFLRGFAKVETTDDVATLGFCEDQVSSKDGEKESDSVAKTQVDEEMKEASIEPKPVAQKEPTQETTGPQLSPEDMQSVEDLFEKEMGFSQIIQMLKEEKKPIIGHNMIYDAGFLLHQFVDKLPDTYGKFCDLWRSVFPYLYDTKALATQAGVSGKTDLTYLFYKCTTDKKLCNNLVFAYDEAKDAKFALYAQGSGQSHDAGYDAYMTGLVFASLSKYLEIGAIINKPPAAKEVPPTKEVENEGQGSGKGTATGKKPKETKKEKQQKAENEKKQKAVHYSTVQNRPIKEECLADLQNKIMKNIDLPSYWNVNHTDQTVADLTKHKSEASMASAGDQQLPKNELTEAEQSQIQRQEESAFQVTTHDSMTVLEVAALFKAYGDVNVVKTNQQGTVFWIDFEDFDKDTLQATGTTKHGDQHIKELKKLVQTRHKKEIQDVKLYHEADRFQD